jgi:hypothetical protein
MFLVGLGLVKIHKMFLLAFEDSIQKTQYNVSTGTVIITKYIHM